MTETPDTKVEFFFDVTSPNAYLVHKLMPALEARTGISVTYMPCLLGGIFNSTGNKPPVVANAHVPAKVNYEKLEFMRFVKNHKLTEFRFSPDHPIRTVHVMRGALVAERDGFLRDYVDAVMSLAWEKQAKVETAEDLAKALTGWGFDGDALMTAAADPSIKADLFARTEAAVARGVFGVPTYFVGDEMFFGKDKLRDVEEEILRQRQDT